MTDKELIKQEIERRINVCEKYSQLNLTESTCIGNHAQLLELRELKDFIDSLPEEPTSEDLKEEISKWRNHYISVLDNNLKIDLRDIEVIANHFAEWQKNKDLEDSLKSDMTMPNKFYEKGRFDMREEIMKDAVECTWGSYATSSFMSNHPNIECGNKVKIIIVKN